MQFYPYKYPYNSQLYAHTEMVKDIQSYGIIMGRSPLIILSQFHPRPYSQIVDICVGRYICESALLAQIDFIKTDCILAKLEKCVK